MGITTLGFFFQFLHAYSHAYTFSHSAIFGLEHAKQTAGFTLKCIVLCSVLRRGFHNWHDMIWAQKNLEVIAQSDNRGLAVRARARARVRAGRQDVGNTAMHFRSLALDCTVRWRLLVTVRWLPLLLPPFSIHL